VIVPFKLVGGAGAPTLTLVPVNDTVSGDPVNPVYAILNVPVSDKIGVPVGLNVTPTVQLEPFVNAVEQLPGEPDDLAKSLSTELVAETVPIVTVPPVLFVTVTFIVELVVPCCTDPKANVVGETDSAGVSPVPDNVWV
jgi:hypothetical protein